MNYISSVFSFFAVSLAGLAFVNYHLPVQAQTIDPNRRSFSSEKSDRNRTAKTSIPTQDDLYLEPNRRISSFNADFMQTASTVPIVAQNNDIDIENVDPGRATRSGSSYIGIGGNIGLTGDETPVGESSFAIFSKIGLTRTFSVRPSVLIEDDAAILIPLTLDFSGENIPEAQVSIAPYIGGGLAISTGDDSNVGGLITGGLDIPLASKFTANAAANVTFFDDTEVGLQLGVGYNF
jgi:hypothetical protein